MKDKTARILIQIAVDLAEWFTEKFKNRKKEKPDDDQGTSEKRGQG